MLRLYVLYRKMVLTNNIQNPSLQLDLQKSSHSNVQGFLDFEKDSQRRLALISPTVSERGTEESHLGVSVYFACKACLL